jgi:hypothetical protein
VPSFEYSFQALVNEAPDQRAKCNATRQMVKKCEWNSRYRARRMADPRVPYPWSIAWLESPLIACARHFYAITSMVYPTPRTSAVLAGD